MCGIREVDEQTPFELFLSSTKKYVIYITKIVKKF